MRDRAKDHREAETPRNLTQLELAERWRLSGRTLEKWRQTGRGPRYLLVGRHVLYPLGEVEAFEAASLRGAQ